MTSYRALIDCQKKKDQSKLQENVRILVQGRGRNLGGCLISFNRLLDRGFTLFLSSIVAIDKQAKLASADILVMREFFVDVLTGTRSMPGTPCQVASFEFR